MNYKTVIKRVKKFHQNPIKYSSLKQIIISCNKLSPSYVYTKAKLISEQIELNLYDICDRLIDLKKCGKATTLKSYIIKYGEIEGPIKYKEYKNKTTQNLDNFIKRYGEIEGPIKYKEYNKSKTHSLESYIKRHGEIEGPAKHKEYWETTNFSTKKSRYKKRYGKDWEKPYNKLKEKQRACLTLNGYIKRYGEIEGLKLYKRDNKKRSNSISAKSYAEKLLKEGFTIDEILIKIKNRWDNTSKRAFVERYGEIEGPIKYKEYNIKNRKNNILCVEYYRDKGIPDNISHKLISNIQSERQPKKQSIESKKYFNKTLKEFDLDIDYEFNIQIDFEYYKICKQRNFFYDCILKNEKIIIEYHGVLFHDDVDYDSTKFLNKSYFETNYNYDLFKKWYAEHKGYEVFVIRSWEKEMDTIKLLNRLGIKEESTICKIIL